jgi:hypothetical protein
LDATPTPVELYAGFSMFALWPAEASHPLTTDCAEV